MNKKILLIHDLTSEEFQKYIPSISSTTTIFSAKENVLSCLGCFDCWIKTPGICVINDRSQDVPAILADSDELVLISKNRYGGFSSEIKAVLDRGIPYLMPYFKIVENEMHHTMRYINEFILSVYFYGDDITEEERMISRQLVKANGLNLGAENTKIYFFNTLELFKEIVL